MPDPEKDSAAVQQFFANMEAAFRAHSLWSGCSEEELESAGEVSQLYSLLYTLFALQLALLLQYLTSYLLNIHLQGLEKYVMTKLFTRVFAAYPDDVKDDEQISEKVALVQQFIRPENLDIKPTFQNESSWLVSVKS